MAHISGADGERALLHRWQDTRYLQTGSDRQRAAWADLHELRLFERLMPFEAVLIGTIPLGVDVPGSDLDIVCSTSSLPALERLLVSAYGNLPGYRSAFGSDAAGEDSVVVDCFAPTFPVQIFGQRVPVTSQRGYRHLLVEFRLLDLAPEAREAIAHLRAAGLKTEPAFARYFSIPGDPYSALYEMSYWDRAKIKAFVLSVEQEM